MNQEAIRNIIERVFVEAELEFLEPDEIRFILLEEFDNEFNYE